MLSSAHHIIYNQIFDAITPKPATFDPTRKLIPTYFQNIIQNLMLFPNVKRSTVPCDLAIFGLNVPYFGQVHLQHQILLCNQSDKRMTKYRLDFDAIIQYQKDKMSLWSQTSVFRVLSLPFGIRPLPCNSVPKLHETFPTNIGRYYTSSPASAYA